MVEEANVMAASMSIPGGMSVARSAQLPLCMVHEGETVHVAKVRGNDDFHKRLEALGFVEGAEVLVVSQSGNSGTIVKVKGAQLGVDRQTGMHIVTC